MNEEQKAPEEAAQEAPPASEPAVPASMDAKEVEEGKAFALLSYILSLVGLPFFLVPLLMRNNEFSLYHAKQCLMIWLVAIVGGTVAGVLTLVCIGWILIVAVSLFCLVLEILGIVNTSKGEAKPLPLVGQWAEDWFKGLTKA